MILVDACVWIDHLRWSDTGLIRVLTEGQVCSHPMVLGELALGRLRDREQVLRLVGALPRLGSASDEEVLDFVERRQLVGIGLGWVDANLLAAVALAPGSVLWSRDRPLAEAAASLGLGWLPP